MGKPTYFAHATNAYNKPIEKAALQFIADNIAGGDIGRIENPNQPHHQEGYDRYAERVKRSYKNHKGMNYFYDEVLPGCGSCVAMPYLDGRVGLGVAGEALWFLERGLPVWYMEPDLGETVRKVEARHGKESLAAHFAELRAISNAIYEFIKDPLKSGIFRIRTFTDEEVEMLKADKDVGSALLVPHEETRLRSWFVYGQKERPYEAAHLVSPPIPEGFYPEK